MSKICFCIPENCDTCLEYSVSYCPGRFITIPSTNLINGTTYFLFVRDKLGNIFKIFVHPSSGAFLIDTNALPTGMFSPTFGSLDMFVSTDPNGNTIQPLVINSVSYNCIIFSINEIVYLTDDSGCEVLTNDNNEPLTT